MTLSEELSKLAELRAGGTLTEDEFARAKARLLNDHGARTDEPVVAAVTGYALGGGLELALCADFRVLGESAKVGQPEILLGIIPGAGGTQRLPRLIGPAKAKDIVYTGRFVEADEALRIGLVNRLYPPDQLREQTYAYARDLADFVSPSAIAVIKRQLYDVPFQTLAEATIDANREMVVALRGSDFREGVASFMEKRPPRFTGK